MKKQRYIVEIEMPDGDMVSANWLKDIIRHDCDSEDDGRQKVSVRELNLPKGLDSPKGLDEAAKKCRREVFYGDPDIERLIEEVFKAGAEWMASRRSNEILK